MVAKNGNKANLLTTLTERGLKQKHFVVTSRQYRGREVPPPNGGISFSEAPLGFPTGSNFRRFFGGEAGREQLADKIPTKMAIS